MAVVSVEVPDRIAKQIKKDDIISINALYNYDEDVSSWKSVKLGEKSSIVLDFLRDIK